MKHCRLCAHECDAGICDDCADAAIMDDKTRLAYLTYCVNENAEMKREYLEFIGFPDFIPIESELWLTRYEPNEDRYCVCATIRWINEDRSHFMDWLGFQKNINIFGRLTA